MIKKKRTKEKTQEKQTNVSVCVCMLIFVCIIQIKPLHAPDGGMKGVIHMIILNGAPAFIYTHI